MSQVHLPPVVVSYLAPADRCNQRCPACVITEVFHEPVSEVALSSQPVLPPEHYAKFLTQLVTEGIPVARASFQGYEVTLPQSWPYLEAVFEVANRHHVPTGFITNGMLLHKWAERIESLGPRRISVSLDGADPAANDPIRGLQGAFQATTRSLARFLEVVPSFRPRVTIASCLHSETNFRSLLQLPPLVRSLGVSRWALSFAVRLVGDRAEPVQTRSTLVGWCEELREAASAHGLHCYVNDELGFLKASQDVDTGLRHLVHPEFLYRFDPLGYVRIGKEAATRWDPASSRRWDPQRDDAADTVGYWQKIPASPSVGGSRTREIEL